VTRAVDKGHVSVKEELAFAELAFGLVFFIGLVGLEAVGRGALHALVQLGVGVPEFNSDVTDSFLSVFDSLPTRLRHFK